MTERGPNMETEDEKHGIVKNAPCLGMSQSLESLVLPASDFFSIVPCFALLCLANYATYHVQLACCLFSRILSWRCRFEEYGGGSYTLYQALPQARKESIQVFISFMLATRFFVVIYHNAFRCFPLAERGFCMCITKPKNTT